jgi:2-keto-4-pentenoate hydratase/2-oxohepta-3-ene-1,7-dioic acid hydratase in catechol pathway
MQQANTADMIFPVPMLIAELSRGTTLLAGTVLLTGTPAGVGAARTPPRFLREGDVVEITIECVGTLRNPVRGASA